MFLSKVPTNRSLPDTSVKETESPWRRNLTLSTSLSRILVMNIWTGKDAEGHSLNFYSTVLNVLF